MFPLTEDQYDDLCCAILEELSRRYEGYEYSETFEAWADPKGFPLFGLDFEEMAENYVDANQKLIEGDLRDEIRSYETPFRWGWFNG